MRVYKIMGSYQGSTEEIDEFTTEIEALKMLSEYRMAYGKGWHLYIKPSKN